MAKIDTLSMITGGRIERAAITDLQNDLRAQLQGIEIRIDALNSQLGTLSADIKIKEHDCARAYGFGYKAQAKESGNDRNLEGRTRGPCARA